MMQIEILLAGVFILVLVIVATAKSALDELSDVSLRVLANEKETPPHAEFLRHIVDHYRRFSFTLTFGIHLSIASIAILISSIAFKISSSNFLALAFGVMLLTLILFRQVIPLLLTQNDPARMLIHLRHPLKVIYPALSVIAHPIYHYLRGLREQEVEAAAEEEHGDDVEEIKALIDVGEKEGIIEGGEGEMIESIVRFGDRTVGDVMTPRASIVAVEATTLLEAVRDVMVESKYSRLPVYREQLDNIEGIVYVRDLLGYWAEARLDRTAIDLARPTYFIPETKPTDEMLREMQKAKVQMAIVIDEYGSLAGLVTLEDLIEEIVGEIEDEDEPEPFGLEAEVIEEEDGNYIVKGTVQVGKLERLTGVELAADDFSTVAGLVINELGHLPKPGETLDFRGLHFEVLDADERRVNRVRFHKHDETSPVEQKSNGEIASHAAVTNNER